MHADRVIEITPEPFGTGFDVKVQPPLETESLDREYRDYKEARGWAGGLRLARGWRIVDQCGEHPHG